MKEHHSQKDNNSGSRATANDHSDKNGASMPAVPALTNNTPAQLAKPKNDTGLPDDLKEGIENLSGMAMDDTRVHYNSSRPATVNALAFAQGNEIHVAPGQEKHLPHEAWHVVQQKAGRVQSTSQVNGVPVNTDPALEKEADFQGSVALQKKEAVTSLSSVSSYAQTPVLQGVFQVVIGYLGREILKETARETGLRFLKGQLAEQLSGLENEVLKKVLEAMQKNPELLKALQKAQIATHLQAAAQKLSAPIAEKIRSTISNTLNSIAEQFPDLKEEIEAYKASLEQRLNENMVFVAIKNTMEIAAATVAQLGANLALTKGFDFAANKAIKSAISIGSDVVKESVDDATKLAKEVLEEAAKLENIVEGVDELMGPLNAIRKPIRAGVKGAMDMLEESPETATEAAKKLKEISNVGGLKDALSSTADDVAEKATGAIKDSSITGGSSNIVKYGAHTIQAAFVLSDIAKAKTYTESTIAILKPVVAMSGTLVSGPMAPLVGVAAPVILEQVLKKLETVVEPKLISANAFLQSIPGLGLLASGSYQSAAFVGRGINALPSTLGSTAASIYNTAWSIIFPQSQQRPTGQQQPGVEEPAKEPTPPRVEEDDTVNMELDIQQMIDEALQERLQAKSKMEDVD